MRRLANPNVRVYCLLGGVLAASAVVYFWGLGRASLDDAEAYSSFIATRQSLRDVFEAAQGFDPGKPGLYAFVLHWYCGVFGSGEVALRSFSAAFGLADVLLVFALTDQLFGSETALAAAAIWAFNPIILLLARWARMYTMLVALALADLLALRAVQERPSAARVLAMGALGAAMLYTHLGALLVLGAEVALLARDAWRGRRMLPGCLAMAITLVLFAPYAPIALHQIQALVLGHWLDWIGAAAHRSPGMKAAVALAAVVAGLFLVFGPPLQSDRSKAGRGDNPEPARWCATWLLLPLLALGAGSLIVHPMFKIRYIAPVMAAGPILLAAGLAAIGPKARKLGAMSIVVAFLTGIFADAMIGPRPSQVWREIGRDVAARGSPSQPVFFEAGYVMSRKEAAGLDPDALTRVLPLGFLRVPFDYYFAGPNPRHTVNPFRPAEARETMARTALASGGAWLVSHASDAEARMELPGDSVVSVQRVTGDAWVGLYHIVPRKVHGR